MNAEALKKVAELLDYKNIEIIRDNVWYDYNVWDLHSAKIFSLTNKDILYNVIEYFKFDMDYLKEKKLWRVNIPNHKFSKGKTLKEAIEGALINEFKNI